MAARTGGRHQGESAWQHGLAGYSEENLHPLVQRGALCVFETAWPWLLPAIAGSRPVATALYRCRFRVFSQSDPPQYLKRRGIQINDLYTDLADGLVLINLMEILSSKVVVSKPLPVWSFPNHCLCGVPVVFGVGADAHFCFAVCLVLGVRGVLRKRNSYLHTLLCTSLPGAGQA